MRRLFIVRPVAPGRRLRIRRDDAAAFQGFLDGAENPRTVDEVPHFSEWIVVAPGPAGMQELADELERANEARCGDRVVDESGGVVATIMEEFMTPIVVEGDFDPDSPDFRGIDGRKVWLSGRLPALSSTTNDEYANLAIDLLREAESGSDDFESPPEADEENPI